MQGVHSPKDSTVSHSWILREPSNIIHIRTEKQMVVTFSCRGVQTSSDKRNGRRRPKMGRKRASLQRGQLQEGLCWCASPDTLQ